MLKRFVNLRKSCDPLRRKRWIRREAPGSVAYMTKVEENFETPICVVEVFGYGAGTQVHSWEGT